MSTQLISIGYRIDGQLVAEHLEQAVDRVVARHMAFRTVFDGSAFPARQRVSAEPPRLEFVGRIDDDGCRDRLIMEPMDLQTGPLARFLLIERPSWKEFWICIEHIVADGWSLDLILREISQAYSDPLVQLPPVAVQNHEHGIFEARYCESPSGQAARSYWKDRLSGGSPWLPFDYPAAGGVNRVDNASPCWQNVRLDIGQKQVAQACKAGKFTPYSLILASLCLAVSRRSGLKSVPVMTPVANRWASELDATVTWCSNLISLSITADCSSDQLTAFGSVKDQAVEGISFAAYPIHRLASEFVPQLCGLTTLPFPILYLDVEAQDNEFALEDVSLERLPSPVAPVRTGLLASCKIERQSILLQFECGQGFVSQAELRSLVDDTARELRSSVARLLKH